MPPDNIDPLILDNLRPGAAVSSTDGRKVGKLYAVVVDARDDEVTHIVVNTGPFFPAPGFGAPNLVSVPIDEMGDAREKTVILKCTKRKFSRMPAYADWSFTKPPDPGVWRMENALRLSMGGWSLPMPTEIIHKARFEHEIARDAHVWRIEPHTHIGDVDRILIDEQTREIEALVVRRGVVFSHDVILPIHYVVEVLDDIAHVNISDDDLERLAEFQAPPEPRSD
jgi:sporulation protein YlmC with PRC-barrel domain